MRIEHRLDSLGATCQCLLGGSGGLSNPAGPGTQVLGFEVPKTGSDVGTRSHILWVLGPFGKRGC